MTKADWQAIIAQFADGYEAAGRPKRMSKKDKAAISKRNKETIGGR